MAKYGKKVGQIWQKIGTISKQLVKGGKNSVDQASWGQL